MLEELMRECRNWFVTHNGVHLGEFSIKGGSIALPFCVPDSISALWEAF